MIEKFTPQELDVIRRELLALDGKRTLTKSVVFAEEERKIRSMFENEDHIIASKSADTLSTSACADDVWKSLTSICDHTLKNYTSHKVWNKGCGFMRSKYVAVDADSYRHLLDELIQLIEKEMR